MKQQADILQVLVKTYGDLQEGNGTVPAYSQIADTGRPEEQMDQTIAAAEQDLLAARIDKSILVKHRDLIKEWLETVILAPGDGQEDNEEKAKVAERGEDLGSSTNTLTNHALPQACSTEGTLYSTEGKIVALA